MAEKEIKATEQTDMDKLTTEMMEHICDNLCKHPIRVGQTQDELDSICAECKMGKYVCDILNAYNHRMQQLSEVKESSLDPIEMCKVAIALDKLKEYQRLEEQGLLLKLPCKVGTQVYIINHYWIDEGFICGIAEADDIDCFCFKVYEDPDTYTLIAIDDFKKGWFLTEQEAQAALEKMNRDKPKQYVLVSQGIEIYRTTDKEEAERMMNESNSKYYEYLQRCADEGERPADNMIYLYEEE